MEKAKQMAKHQPASYKDLISSGIKGFTGDHKITVKLASVDLYFTLVWQNTGRTFCVVHPIIEHGQVYSYYDLHLIKTGLHQAMLDVLPINLPDGIVPKGAAAMQYLNADGSFEDGGVWLDTGKSPRRRNNKQPKGSPRFPVVINDTTGKYTADKYDFKVQATYRQHTDLKIGFLPGTVDDEEDWLASMDHGGAEHYHWERLGLTCYEHKGLADYPLWDVEQMQDVASKTLDAARKFMEHAPHMKLAFYPAILTHDRFTYLSCRFNVGDDTIEQRPRIVVGRDDEGNPIWLYLPSVVLYWTKPNKSNHMASVHRWIACEIPPVGCRSLAVDDWNSGSDSRINFDSLKETSTFNEAMKRNSVPARAYHCLMCMTRRRVDANVHRKSNAVTMKGSVERNYYQWTPESTVVRVTDNHDLGANTWRTCYQMTPYAAAPHAAFNLYEESEILEALPVC